MKNFKKNGGFTLVELIVVIAILAILAAVAIPAYSGYIENANRAGDEQLVAAINRAFVSACMENGIDNTRLTKAQVNIAIVDGKINYDTVQPEAIRGAFKTFMEGNTSSTFKFFKGLNFIEVVGSFEGTDEASRIAQLKEYLTNSSFNGKLDAVVIKVDSLTGQLADYMKSNFSSEAFAGSGFAAYLTELGIASDDYEGQSQAAMLYLAQNAAGMTDTNITNATNSVTDMLATLYVNDGQNGVTDADIAALAGETGSSLASYAVLYAVAEGFALQQGTDSTEYQTLKNAKLEDPQSVLTAINGIFANNDNALNYLNAGNVEKDVNAYFEAMKTINSSQSQLESEVQNGGNVMDSETIQDLLNQLGK